jgi:hypothetical protein
MATNNDDNKSIAQLQRERGVIQLTIEDYRNDSFYTVSTYPDEQGVWLEIEYEDKVIHLRYADFKKLIDEQGAVMNDGE